jgi:8-oxo-dGTP diphosphatase
MWQVSVKNSFKDGDRLAKNPTSLLVVAALIRDDRGRLLLQQALPGKAHAGQWEFPGGKVENGENPRFALRREIAEELGLTVDQPAMVPTGFADQEAAGTSPAIVLILYDCPLWRGVPQSCEGQAWDWFVPAVAARLALAPLDRSLLERLFP